VSKVKIEAFLLSPACSGSISLSRLLKEIEQEFGNKVEIVTDEEHDELFEEYNLTATPAVVVGELVTIIGVCPSKESLVSALRGGRSGITQSSLNYLRPLRLGEPQL